MGRKNCFNLKIGRMRTISSFKSILFGALFFVLSLYAPKMLAQNTSTQGKEFWLTFMQNGFKEHPDGGWVLNQVLISAKRNCTGTVSNPLTGWSQPFSVSANNITTIEIPERQGYHDIGNVEILSDRAIHIVANDTVSVYCTNIAHVSFDASFVLPVESLGDEYIIQSFDQSVTGEAGDVVMRSETSSFVIIATEDNTEVSITPTTDLLTGQHLSGIPFVVSMNRGQTYHVRSTGTGNRRDLSGTRVTASNGKGIAVFNGNTLTSIPTTIGNGFDHVVEQAMPLRSWGKQFVVTSSSNRNRDFVKITSSANNNAITKNGTPLVTLQANESYTFSMMESERSCFIAATQPCAVYLYENSNYDQNLNGGLGDPSMVWIAPIEQRINEVTFSTFDHSDLNMTLHSVNIIVNSEDIDKVYLDGEQLSPELFTTANGNSDYSYIRKDIFHGVHHISCVNGFNAHVYGFGAAKSYAYLVGSNTIDLTSHLIVNNESAAMHINGYDICENEAPEFDLHTNFECSQVNWDFGDGVTGTGYPLSHTYLAPGDYTVSCDVYTQIQGENAFVSTMTTVIHVHPLHQVEDYKIACGSYEIGNQIFMESGVYEYQLEDMYGCDSIVTLNLTITHDRPFDLEGPQWVSAATDIVAGPYRYWVADSLLFAPNSLQWSCSNPEWTITPIGNGYQGSLWALNIGEGFVMASTNNNDCDSVFTVHVVATWFDVNENEETKILIYPNPAPSQVTIQTEDIIGIRLVDVLGLVVLNERYEQTDVVELSISHLPQGVYLVEITTKRGKIVRRLVLAR